MSRSDIIKITTLVAATLNVIYVFTKENKPNKKEKLLDDFKGEVLVLKATPAVLGQR